MSADQTLPRGHRLETFASEEVKSVEGETVSSRQEVLVRKSKERIEKKCGRL